MTKFIDQHLRVALDTFAPDDILIDHRLITAGDEDAILPEEADKFERSAIQVRRASGAARIVARALLDRLGHTERALPKSESGAPIWPRGIIGSLAHDARIAIAAVGKSEKVSALGIDIEPAEMLSADLLRLIATPQERETIECDPYRGRLLFVAKEAVYKAVHPLDHKFLDYHDIEVDLAGKRAIVRNGRIVDLRFCIATHLVAVAFLPAV